jgi:hypothetical protein
MTDPNATSQVKEIIDTCAVQERERIRVRAKGNFHEGRTDSFI